MTSRHKPVLADLVTQLLLEGRSGGVFLDITVGGGGYFEQIINNSKDKVVLYGIDRDPEALAMTRERLHDHNDLHLAAGNHADLAEIAEEWKLKEIDGIIGDFGLSSNQLENPARGFSYNTDGDLDMRYSDEQEYKASDLINNSSRRELIRIFKEYGEERMAGPLATAIVKSRPLLTTSELTAIVSKVCPGRFLTKSLGRVFMSLRVAVNGELEAIDRVLPVAKNLLRKGGRMVFLSYDSLEDKRVKAFFRKHSQTCSCPPEFPVCVCGARPELKLLSNKVIRPDEAEMSDNPRSKSAKLRAAERIYVN